MRIKLELEKLENKFLPINYQYELHSWIYKTISKADSEFATWLHDKGYRIKNKEFKLFNFSNFYISKFKFHSNTERLEILTDTILLEISFYLDESANPFLEGLFGEQEFTIGDKLSSVRFYIKSVEFLEEENFLETNKFKSISPVCVSYKKEGSSTVSYLSPEDKLYEKILKLNLIDRYNSVPFIEQIKDIEFNFKLISSPKSKLIKIKSGTTSETKLRGFQYICEIKTSPEIFKLIYHSGLGEKTSMGFGYLKKLNDSKNLS